MLRGDNNSLHFFFYKILPIACTQAGTLQLYHKCRTQHKDKTVHTGLGNMPDSRHDPEHLWKCQREKENSTQNTSLFRVLKIPLSIQYVPTTLTDTSI